jgi:predicted transcriptional regulator
MIEKFCREYNTTIREIDRNCKEMDMSREHYITFCKMCDFYNKYNATQADLSQLSGIPKSTLSYIQNGKIQNGKSIQKLHGFLDNYQKTKSKPTFSSWIKRIFNF